MYNCTHRIQLLPNKLDHRIIFHPTYNRIHYYLFYAKTRCEAMAAVKKFMALRSYAQNT